jgi:hypothetical protein
MFLPTPLTVTCAALDYSSFYLTEDDIFGVEFSAKTDSKPKKASGRVSSSSVFRGDDSDIFGSVSSSSKKAC